MAGRRERSYSMAFPSGIVARRGSTEDASCEYCDSIERSSGQLYCQDIIITAEMLTPPSACEGSLQS